MLGVFDDLIPSASAAEAQNPFADLIPSQGGKGGLFDDLIPANDRGALGTTVQYGQEFSKGFAEGAKNTVAGSLKGTGALLATVGPENTRRALSVMERIDRGESVAEMDDPVGYQHMTEEQRAQARQQFTQSAAQPRAPITEHPLYRAGEAVSDFGKEALAPAPGFEGSWTRDIGGGFGSVATGIGVSMVPGAGPVVAPAMFLTGGMGEAAEKAIKSGASEEQIAQATRLGSIPGATDVVDTLLPMMGSTGRVIGFVKRVGLAAVKGALAEGGQEGVQQLMQNMIAQGIYKPDQDVWEDVPRSAAIGAIVGKATSGLVAATESKPQPETIAAQPVPAVVPQDAVPAETVIPTEPAPAAPAPVPAAAPVVQPVAPAPAPVAPPVPVVQPPTEAPAPPEPPSNRMVLQDMLDDPRSADEIRADLAAQEKAARAEREAAANWQPSAEWQEVPRGANVTPDLEVKPGADQNTILARIPPTPGTRDAPVRLENPEDVHVGAEQTAQPTPDQAKAGNYQKRHLKWQGLDISIETEAGAERTGIGPDGTPWSVTMPVPYGHVLGTKGADGDPLDMSIGPNPKAPQVFVVDQIDPNNLKFDETKSFQGFNDEAAARQAYEASFSDGTGPQRAGAISTMTVAQWKQWSKNGDHSKAVAYKPPVDLRPAARPKGPLSLFQYLASKGGIRDQGGELRALGITRVFIPGYGPLIRPAGMPLDRARGVAVEGAYLRDQGDISGGLSQSTVADLLEALDRESRGSKVYSDRDIARAQEQDAERQAKETADRVKATEAEVRAIVKEQGFVATEDHIREAAQIALAEGAEPMEALGNVLERTAVADVSELEQSEREEIADEQAPPFELHAADAVGQRPAPARQQPARAEPAAAQAGEGPRLQHDEAQRDRGEAPAAEPAPAAGRVEPAAPPAPTPGPVPTRDEAARNLETARAAYADIKRKLDALERRLEESPQQGKNALDQERIDRSRQISERMARTLRKHAAAAFDSIDDAKAALKRASAAPAARPAPALEDVPVARPAPATASTEGDLEIPEYLRRSKAGAVEPAPTPEPTPPPAPTTERTEAGQQTVLPGAEKISGAEQAQRKVDQPLKPKTAQKPPAGLFSDDAAQTDLVDMARAKPKTAQSVGQLLTPAARAQRRAIRDAVRNAVMQVAGRDTAARMQLVERIDDEISEAWGTPEQGDFIAGQYEIGRDLITVALAENPDAVHTAYHEGWHSIETALTDAERSILERQADRLRDYIASKGAYTRERLADVTNQEVFAEAAATYASENSGAGLHIMVRRIFDKIARMIGSVRSALNGMGFRNAEDIFADFAKGKMAARKEEAARQRSSEAETFADVADIGRQFAEPVAQSVARIRGAVAGINVPAELVADHLEARNLPKLAGISRALKIGKANTTEFRVQVQDKFVRWQKIQEAVQGATGQPIPESMNVYMAESLYYGRTGQRLEKLEKEHIDPLISEIKKQGLTLEQVNEFLMARHAPERNRVVGRINPDIANPSGLSDAEAKAILDKIDASGKRPAYNAVEERVRALIDETRVALLAGGLINKATHDAWEATYKHYVPLRGWADETEAEDYGTGKGFDIRGPESKRALGRSTIADSPLAYAMMQAQQAIVRAEKAQVGRTAMRFVNANPAPDLWEINKGDTKRDVDPKTGLVVEKQNPLFVPADNVFAMKIDGETYYINFKGEHGANLARALKNLGMVNLHPALQLISTLTRLQARLATSWNPDFMIPNFVRDIGEAFINMQEQEQKKFARSFAKHIPGAMGGAFLALTDRTGGKYAEAFREFDKAGGRIRFFGMENVEDIKAAVESKMRRLEGGAINTLRDAGERAVSAIEIMNGSIENATRLAAYMAARDVGLSPAKAASIAREMTVNFNRKGELGSTISALYLFANAAMQGTTRMVGAMKNKKVRRFAYGLAALGSAMAAYNLGAGGDDDDGTPFYLKLPHWIRDTNLIVMWPKGLGHDGQYVKIPLPYGYSFFYVIGSRLTGLGLGKEKAGKATSAIAASVLDAFDPLGKDENMLAQVTPSIFRPAVHISTNVNWTGRPINPEPMSWNKSEPDSARHFRSASEFSVGAAQKINALTGGTKHEPGLVDWSPGTIDYWIGFVSGGLGRFAKNSFDTAYRGYQGQEWQVDKTPIVRRFYGGVEPAADRQIYFEEREKVKAAHERRRAFQKDDDRAGEARVEKANAAELEAYGEFMSADRQRSKITQDIDELKADKSLTAADRERRIKEKEREELSLMLGARKRLEQERRAAPR